MPKVTIIGMNGCSHCQHAKEYMTKNKIPFTFIDIDQPQNSQYRKGLDAVPKICIEGTNECIIGFNEEKIKRILK